MVFLKRRWRWRWRWGSRFDLGSTLRNQSLLHHSHGHSQWRCNQVIFFKLVVLSIGKLHFILTCSFWEWELSGSGNQFVEKKINRLKMSRPVKKYWPNFQDSANLSRNNCQDHRYQESRKNHCLDNVDRFFCSVSIFTDT
jgi:hypothetical protein